MKTPDNREQETRPFLTFRLSRLKHAVIVFLPEARYHAVVSWQNKNGGTQP
jgi:hypothetical protein